MTDDTSISLEEQLILQVKQYPAIYDKNHKDYKDRGPGGVVANIWTNIFQTMKVDHPTFVFLPLIMGRAHCYCIESAKKFQICLLFMLT